MESKPKSERNLSGTATTTSDSSPRLPPSSSAATSNTTKVKSRTRDKDASAAAKRRCVSTACIACRKRKSKCDGQLPKCAACASVYLTECEYAPHTDHRRKGVYKKDIDSLKTRNSTLQTLIHALLNFDEEHVPELVRQIRTCESLEDLAESIVAKTNGAFDETLSPDSPVYAANSLPEVPQFEAELSGKMGDLLVEGSVKFIGGTSNLHYLPNDSDLNENAWSDTLISDQDPVLSWTSVTDDKDLVLHLLNMYFCWHYAYFTTLSKKLFYDDFYRGRPTQYCSALLVNVMLSLGCHFSTIPGAYANPDDSATAGDHFFREAKRLMHENDEFAATKVCTVQALALMSVREAGCGREGKGWVYSGMSFRMAMDLGLNIDARGLNDDSRLSDEDTDARRITFWGCFLFDKYAQHIGGCGKLADFC
jgi:Fungal specific transcription factor domain/Fungal Zn(2)-Cys(6) binuclear cluster domain